MKKLAVLFVCVALLASCDGFKGGSKDLKAENDSLLMELNQRNAELDDMMGTFNEVQEGFRKINAKFIFGIVGSQTDNHIIIFILSDFMFCFI